MDSISKEEKRLLLYIVMSLLSLHTLPLEILFRILDELNEKQLFLCASIVCQRLNTITNFYPRYQVEESEFCRRFEYVELYFARHSLHLILDVNEFKL